jgi:hypothetical protein
MMTRDLRFVPAADPVENDEHGNNRDDEPGSSLLAVRKDDEGGEERADGGACIATHLEKRLREAVASTRGQARYAGGLWMEDGGADADAGSGEEQSGKRWRDGKQKETNEGDDHADGQDERFGGFVGPEADDGLKERGGDLIGESDEADLGKVKLERGFQNRVDGGQQRLHHVVDEVANADGGEDTEERGVFGLGIGVQFDVGGGGAAHGAILCVRL